MLNCQIIAQVPILFTLLKRPTGKRWSVWTITGITPILLPHSAQRSLLRRRSVLITTSQRRRRRMRRRRATTLAPIQSPQPTYRCTHRHATTWTNICLMLTMKIRVQGQIQVHPRPRVTVLPQKMRSVRKFPQQRRIDPHPALSILIVLKNHQPCHRMQQQRHL